MRTQEEAAFAVVLGCVLSVLRERHGLRQEDVAARVNLGQSSLSRYEAGETTPDVFILRALGHVYAVDVMSLTETVFQRVGEAAQTFCPPLEGAPWWSMPEMVRFVRFAVPGAMRAGTT